VRGDNGDAPQDTGRSIVTVSDVGHGL
jgi:hypothetical protein